MLDILILVAFQIIQVNQTDPCFLNYTAGAQMWHNCGIQNDYLQFSLMGWEWITGGYFSMVFAAVIIMYVYIKYHTVIYPILIGVIMLPISYFLFPNEFLTFALIMVGVSACILVWYVFVRQTKEYSG